MVFKVGLLRRGALVGVLAGLAAIGVAVPTAAAAPPMGVSCGSTISQPGDYFLMGDCSGVGIRIAASDVKLKLDGHTMNGGVFSSVFDGVDVSGSRVLVEGPGTITHYMLGIALFPSSSGDEVIGTTTNANVQGVQINGSGDEVVYASASGNANGILLLPGATGNNVVANTTDGNGFAGIHLDAGATANEIHGNTALNNGSFDLADDNPGCDSNDWSGNHFANSSNPSCIH